MSVFSPWPRQWHETEDIIATRTSEDATMESFAMDQVTDIRCSLELLFHFWNPKVLRVVFFPPMMQRHLQKFRPREKKLSVAFKRVLNVHGRNRAGISTSPAPKILQKSHGWGVLILPNNYNCTEQPAKGHGSATSHIWGKEREIWISSEMKIGLGETFQHACATNLTDCL